MPKKDLPCTYLCGCHQKAWCRNIENTGKLSDDEET